jgi:hypothetical protein
MKVSDILKNKKTELEAQLQESNTRIQQATENLDGEKDIRDQIVLDIQKIDLFLEKEVELDAVADNN